MFGSFLRFAGLQVSYSGEGEYRGSSEEIDPMIPCDTPTPAEQTPQPLVALHDPPWSPGIDSVSGKQSDYSSVWTLYGFKGLLDANGFVGRAVSGRAMWGCRTITVQGCTQGQLEVMYSEPITPTKTHICSA